VDVIVRGGANEDRSGLSHADVVGVEPGEIVALLGRCSRQPQPSGLSGMYIVEANPICWSLFKQPMRLVFSLAIAIAGKSRLARMAMMMAMTPSNSIRVKAEGQEGFSENRR